MSYFSRADLNYDGQLDAANRLRVSQITTLGDYKQFNGVQPLLINEEVIGGVFANPTWSEAEGGVIMPVAENLDKIVRQTKQWHNYFSGKSQLFEVTASDFHPQEGVTKRMGYYSSNTTTPFSAELDGIFIETANGAAHTFNIYKDGTSVLTVSQANWNVDTLGAGALNPSGITVTSANFQRFTVFAADFLYLGGTSVAFGFFINRKFIPCHVYNHALTNNTIQAPMIISPNQPLRWEIFSTGGVGTMNQICGAVASEGSIDEIGITRGINTGTSPISYPTSGTEYAMIGIRLKSAYRNITVLPGLINILSTTNDDFRWRLLINPTVAGTFTYSDLADSSLQRAIGGATNTIAAITSGTEIASGYGASQLPFTERVISRLRIGSTINGTMDTLVLAVAPLSTNMGAVGSLGIEEFL